ncbi:MAG: hypothetical protein HQL89_04335 [Magnetococcales bacterium]|nr:hypothetical protein [Magnetococcales bacterium]
MNKSSGCDDDYYDAAERHRRDAELLFKAGRMANADHLYGLAAECLLKAFWERHFHDHFTHGKKNRKFPHMDGNRLWNDFMIFMDGRAGIMLPWRFLEGCPYDDWHVSQRYCNERDIMQERVEARRKWTRLAFNMLIEHC